jgi:hypothetical protein
VRHTSGCGIRLLGEHGFAPTYTIEIFDRGPLVRYPCGLGFDFLELT